MAREISGLIIVWLTLVVARPAPAQTPKATELSQIRDVLQQARETASGIQRIDILAKIASVQVEAGDRANARMTLENALSIAAALPGDKDFDLAEIAVLQAKIGNFDEALKIAGPSGYPADSRADDAIGKIAVLQAKAGDAKRALQIVERIRYPNVRAEALASIALAQAVSGESAADCTTSFLLRWRKSTSSCLPRISLFKG